MEIPLKMGRYGFIMDNLIKIELFKLLKLIVYLYIYIYCIVVVR
jgi:hypothetical protein